MLAITGYCDVDQGTAAGQAARSREQAITDIRPDTIILPAPVSQPESILYGVPAPTTSTTVALAVIDMLVMAVAERIHEGNTATLSACFAKNHPGGAIGAATKQHGALLL